MIRKILPILCIIFVSCNFQKKESETTTNKKDSILKNNSSRTTDSIKLENNQVDKKHQKILDTLPPKKITRFIDDYKRNLNTLVEKKLESIKVTDFEIIEKIVPATQDEFSYYYGLTYSGDEKTAKFDQINELILKYSREDRGSLLFLLLNMAEFVDGEYAEGYFYDIEEVIIENKVKFCAIYKHLSKEPKRRIDGLYMEVCKGIERPEEDDY